MTDQTRPPAADMRSPSPLPARRFSVAILGAGRVGGSIAAALRRAGHQVVGELRRNDDPSPLTRANVIVIAVPDDALEEAAGVVARLGRPGTVVIHTCGLQGVKPLADCGPLVAAIHPAIPVASNEQPFDGATFGVTCPDEMRAWCEVLVRDLGGRALFVPEEQRAVYHAALAMTSNFAVMLAGEGADLLGDHEVLLPLLRATVQNIARLGPDAALTGPVVRGDAGTIAAHLRALPAHLQELYVVNARRTLARAVASGRLDEASAARVAEALDEALVR